MTATPNHDPALLLADHGFVRSLAQKLCQDNETADDIAQEAMVTALGEGPADGTKRRSWLASVTRHLVFNHSRKNRRRVAREQLAAKNLTSTTPAEIVAEEQQRTMVVAAVLKLPEPFREVVLLRYYRGLDTKECAQHLEIPEATVRTRLKRGIERLRTELDRLHGGDRRQWVTALLPFALPTAPATIGVRAMVWAAAVLLLGTFVALPFLMQPDAPAPKTSLSQSSAPAVTADEAHGELGHGVAASQSDEPEDQRISGTAVSAQRVAGIITDGKSKQALANAYITMRAEQPYDDGIPLADLGATHTDENGAFEFSLAPLDHLEPLTRQRVEFYYRIDAPGYAPIEDDCNSFAMRADGVIPLHKDMYPKVLTKGRILDAEGNLVPHARVLVLSENVSRKGRAESTGYFALHLPPKDVPDRKFTLLAYDARHGFSRPCRIEIDPANETVVPDLRVEHRHGCIEGVVRDRNGRPVPDIAIGCKPNDQWAPYTVHGVRIEDFGNLTGGHSVWTDQNGHFAFRVLPPGTYRIRGPGDDQHVELAAFATRRLEFQTTDAQIKVLCEDSQGLPMHPDHEGIYLWQGDAAYEARAQFRKDGFTSELMATAKDMEPNALNEIQPPAFAVVEATWNHIGPMTGSCFLAADQFYGEVRLQITGERRTGSLRVQVTTPDGKKISTLVARASRVIGKQPVPIQFGDAVFNSDNTSRHYPDTQMQGNWWQWVPPDGVMRGLPVGDVHLEIVAAPELSHGRVVGSKNQLIRRSARVMADEIATLTATTSRGCLPRVVANVPSIGEGLDLWYPELVIVFTRKSDGRKFARTVAASNGISTPRLKDGKVEGRVTHAIPAGIYSARLGTMEVRGKSVPWKPHNRYLRHTPIEVEVNEAMTPIAFDLELIQH